ncbi:MAG: DinB family protein [Alphaproteobacteria bacterium]|nr:DinB family protein [Alphaproteobacteria bacterium]
MAFLGLDEDVGPELTMQQLAAKLDMVLAAAARYVAQVPDDRLGDKLPGRDRAYRVLFHHIFNIADSTVAAIESGRPVNYEDLTALPPDDMQTVADIVAYGEGVRARVARWWESGSKPDPVDTYYGSHSLHEVFERTTWHPAQHVRQLMLIHEMLGIETDGPLGAEDFRGLPLPEQVWDG